MDTILVKPRNKEELDLVQTLLKRMDIRAQVVSAEKARKKKAKQEFLDSLPERLKQVELHMQGKIELPDARDLLREI
ncbi:MAG: hypothetical protein MUE71_08570 [Chitinophagaceae bacterium]|jgi:hypothetical protein|nr:hypothetical protein [Chitinophagaceae bacterium]